MTNQRLTKNEVKGLHTILDRLKRLSSSNQHNTNETRIGVYSKTFNKELDDKTIEDIAYQIKLFHQEDIYSLETILKEK